MKSHVKETQILSVVDFKLAQEADSIDSAMALSPDYIVVFETVIQDSKQIISKFEIHGPDTSKIVNRNGWKIIKPLICDYYGRTKLGLQLEDPEGKTVDILSGGFGDDNLIEAKNRIVLKLLRWYEMLSCFTSNSARVDYFVKFKADDEKLEPYIGWINT